MDSYGNIIRIVQQERHQIGRSRQERLVFLLRWSEVKCHHKRSYGRRRKGSSARAWHRLMLEFCWVCQNVAATARHHIIQVQHGGGNDRRNIVPICNGCHAAIHYWMDASEHPLVVEAKEMDRCPF